MKMDIASFQKHVIQGIYLLSYDELEKVNDYVNSFINYPIERDEDI